MGFRKCSFYCLLVCISFFGCKTQNTKYYTPTIICELKTPDNKITLRSQVKFSNNRKSEKVNVVNFMYEKLLFNGLRQNNCTLKQIIIDPNPKINYKVFLNEFWNDESREGKLHRVISRIKNKNSTTSYIVEFDINQLKKYLDENNIK